MLTARAHARTVPEFRATQKRLSPRRRDDLTGPGPRELFIMRILLACLFSFVLSLVELLAVYFFARSRMSSYSSSGTYVFMTIINVTLSYMIAGAIVRNWRRSY